MKTFSAETIAKFLMEHYPTAASWERLVEWINWEMENDFCFLVGDEQDLFGVVFVRPVLDCDRANWDQLYFDQEGDTMFIDLAVTRGPTRQVLQCLSFAVIRRFGVRDKFARRNGSKPPVVKSIRKHIIDRLLKREEAYGI